ncbi:MAG: PilW family protein [Desulfitobacteriaceae bacterium]
MGTKSSDIKKDDNRNSGFTLLEIMIAITIFGFMMLYVSQLMRQEFRLYNSASKQNDLEHNTRSAMMHILDELRLHHSKKIAGSPYDEDSIRVFGSETINDATSTFCLICTDPSDQLETDSLTGIKSFSDEDTDYTIPIIIYFDKLNHELWYQEINHKQLITNKIKSLVLEKETIVIEEQPKELLKIILEAEDTSINKTFELVSWIRLL